MYACVEICIISCLFGSYNTVSNFGCDTIIKKIPVRFNYNEMWFDGLKVGGTTLGCLKTVTEAY